MTGGDPFDLQRFVAAQDGGVYEQALVELQQGCKRTHWMWFIFPQHRALGRSATAKYYGLSAVAEAAAFSAHPLLGARLRNCCIAVRQHLEAGMSAEAIFGPVDALKLRSSMEIFGEADPDEPLFQQIHAMTG